MHPFPYSGLFHNIYHAEIRFIQDLEVLCDSVNRESLEAIGGGREQAKGDGSGHCSICRVCAG